MKYFMLIILFGLSINTNASSIKDVLMKIQTNPEQVVEEKLSGYFSREIKKFHPHVEVYAKAWLIKKLPEPTCNRFALEIIIQEYKKNNSLGVVELNLCEGGLPPIPESLIKQQL